MATVKIVEDIVDEIDSSEIKDGQWAIITKHPCYPENVGDVVVCAYEGLITSIKNPKDDVWDKGNAPGCFKLRILRPGTD